MADRRRPLKTIDPDSEGFWVRPCGRYDVPDIPTRPEWPTVQDMLVDTARRLELLSNEVGFLVRQWLTEYLGEQAAESYAKLHDDSRLSWLPQPKVGAACSGPNTSSECRNAERVTKSSVSSSSSSSSASASAASLPPSSVPLPTIADAYRDTYRDLQAFCVLLEQAVVDHTNYADDVGGPSCFERMIELIKQVLCNCRIHMKALRVEYGNAVERSVMDETQRNMANHVMYRDYVGVMQLVRYAASKANIFSQLKDHREKAPDVVTHL